MPSVDKKITVQYSTAQDLVYKKQTAHYHLTVPTFYRFGADSYGEIEFIFDTGAYLTIISKTTADNYGFGNLRTINASIPIHGYAGQARAELVEIPGMSLGGRILRDVKVAIPHKDPEYIGDNGQVEIKPLNILGLNVLEHFNYFVSSTESMIYFSDNSDYKLPYYLRCSSINAITTVKSA